MPSAVWSGHLHFGLVVMPVRLLVAARTKTTRVRRLYHKPSNESTVVTSFPAFSHDVQYHDSDLTQTVGEMRSTPKDMSDRHAPRDEYSTARQVLQSEMTGEEIRADETVRDMRSPQMTSPLSTPVNQGSRDRDFRHD